MSVAVLWGSKVREYSTIPVHKIWRRVRGPVAATVAVVLDLGWLPLSPARWRDDRGELLQLAQPDFRVHLRRSFQLTCDALIWRKASDHYLGGGVEGGVDFTCIRKEYQRMGRELDYEG
eukprot:2724190-Pyramimonas_sp.AAC.1